MNESLSTLIYIIIYFIIVIFIGFLSYRKSSTEGFLIANRNLKIVSVTSTILASKVGAGTILTFVALAYLYGFYAILLPIGASAGYILFMFFGVHLKEFSASKNFYTLSDYFFHKYGNTTGFISAVIVTVVMLIAVISQFIAGAKIITEVTTFSYISSLLIISITILIYVVLGGFRAVVVTDTIQLIIIIGLLGFLIYIMTADSAFPVIFNSSELAQTPPLGTILSFFLLGILMPFFSAELWQRVYAAKDIRTLRRSLFISATIYPIIGILVIIVGLIISNELQGIDPDMALIIGFKKILPTRFFGLGLIIILAAIMSSADSYLFAAVSNLLLDYYARITTVSKGKLVNHFRYTLTAMIVAIILFSSSLRSLVSAIYILGAFGSIISLASIFSWMIKKNNSVVLISGMTIGFFGTLLLIFIGPVNAFIILKSISCTFAGFLGGSIYYMFQKRKLIISR